MTETRKEKLRNRLNEVMPILSLYCRNEDPKEIAKKLNKKHWWVYKKLSKVLNSL